LGLPAVSIRGEKRKVIKKSSKTGKAILDAKGKKRTALRKKHLSMPKTLRYSTRVTIRDAKGRVLPTVPVVLSLHNSQGQVLDSVTLWTNAQGQITRSYTLTTPKKNTKYSISVQTPTSQRGTRVKNFTINPAKYRPVLR
jgi:hypothetical protein